MQEQDSINVKIYDVILCICFTFFLHGSAYAGLLDTVKISYTGMRNNALFTILIILLLKQRKLRLHSERIVNIWYLFSFVVILSSIRYQSSFEQVKLLLVPVVYFIILQLEPHIIEIFSLAAVSNGLWIIVHSLQINRNFLTPNYSGVYRNSNTFGATMAVLVVAAVVCFLLFDMSYCKFFFCSVIILGLYFEFLSFCRTGILVCFLVACCLLWYYAQKSSNSKYMFTLMMILIMTAIIVVTINFSEVSEFIFKHLYKWGNVTDLNGLTSSRFTMWTDTISHITLLGTLPRYMPHNQWIAVIYYYGLIAGMLFIYFCVLCMINSIKLYKKNGTKKSFVVCLFLLAFFGMGMFEESLGFTGREWLMMGYMGMGYVICFDYSNSRI